MATLPTAGVLRIATRESPLALWQAKHVAARLAEQGVKTELVPLVSGGDVDMRPIDGTRQVGVFTKRIQQALIDNDADVAVHSLKDLPTEPDDRFLLAAVPPRETVADSLVSPQRYDLDNLPEAAVIGTGSRRRAAQLLHCRSDLQIRPIRGNVQTRLAKLESGDYDAIILAEAGILRLGMDELPRQVLATDQMLPAPGQGALGIEVRQDDTRAAEALGEINDLDASSCVAAERTVLAALHGGCLAPIAAHAVIDGKRLRLHVRVLSPEGKDQLEYRDQCDAGDIQLAVRLATEVAKQLIVQGAPELIRSARDENSKHEN